MGPLLLHALSFGLVVQLAVVTASISVTPIISICAMVNLGIWLLFLYENREMRTLGQRRRALEKRRQTVTSQVKPSTADLFLALAGKIGSGKDTAGPEFEQALSKAFPERRVKFFPTAFALFLKKTVCALANQPIEQAQSIDGKNCIQPRFHSTLGEMLQDVGMLMRWMYGEDIWVHLAFDDIERSLATTSTQDDTRLPLHVVNFIDCRMRNEAMAILNRPHGAVVRLNGDPAGVRTKTTRDKHHISETDLDSFESFSAVIDNSVPDIEVLRQKIRQVTVEKLVPLIKK